jgi:hypothetical protein
MVRCGTTLDVVEVWFVDHRGATGRQLFATALQDAAARLAAALG